jgi:cysteinyl-tRNA synthetase
LSYKDELLRQAENDYEKIKRAYNGLYRKLEEAGDGPSESDPEAEKIKAEFTAAMADDFNTANAITAIFKAVKLANRYVREKNPPLGRIRNLLEIFGGFLWVLGIETGVQPLTDEEKELIARYRAARREKNYELSDVLREEILARGLEL